MKHKLTKVFFVVVMLLVVCLLAVACNDGQDNTDPVKYAVTYVGGDGATGTAPSGGNYVEGAKFTLSNAGSLSKLNYTFGGWSFDGQNYSAGAEFTMPAKDVTFTAIWNENQGGGEQPEPTKYTVTFNPNNAEEPEIWTETVLNGEKVSKPANDPTIDNGKIFRYWTNGGVAFDFNTPITGNITLEAEFAYKITFSAGEGEGTVEPMWVKTWRPNAITLPDGTGLSNGNKVFDGWTDGTANYKAGDGYGAFGLTNPVLTAIWKVQSTENGYKLAFSPNQGEGNAPDVQIKQEGDFITLPENKWFYINQSDYPGYVFKGWSTSWKGTPLYQPGDSYTMPAKDVTFMAIWGTESYTITYKAGDHASGDDVVQTKSKNEDFYLRSLSDLKNPFTIDTDNNWAFVGWKLEGDSTNTIYYPDDEFKATANMVFVAQWDIVTQIIAYDQSYSVTLILTLGSNNFGTGILDIYSYETETSEEVGITGKLEGEKLTITILESSSKFEGTYVDNKLSLEISYDGQTYIFAPAEEPALPSVTFDANGGTGNAPENVSIVASGERYVITMPENTFTAPADSAFKEWNVSIDGKEFGAKKVGQTVFVNAGEHVKLTAVWESTIVDPVEGITFIGRCTTPTKTMFEQTTGGETYVKFVVDLEGMTITYTLSTGSENTVALGEGSSYMPDNYGSDALYYSCTMERVSYYIVINADKTKLLLCDSDDEPLTNGEFKVSEGDSDWVAIDTSADGEFASGNKYYFEESIVLNGYTFRGVQFEYHPSLGTVRLKPIYDNITTGAETIGTGISLSTTTNEDNPYWLSFSSANYNISLGKKSDGNFYIIYFSYKNDADMTERVLLTEKPEA